MRECFTTEKLYKIYSLTDFSKHRKTLSETQVFLKVFFELVFEMLHKNTFPVEVLDVLTFEDIYYLRKPIEESHLEKIRGIDSEKYRSHKSVYRF